MRVTADLSILYISVYMYSFLLQKFKIHAGTIQAVLYNHIVIEKRYYTVKYTEPTPWAPHSSPTLLLQHCEWTFRRFMETLRGLWGQWYRTHSFNNTAGSRMFSLAEHKDWTVQHHQESLVHNKCCLCVAQRREPVHLSISTEPNCSLAKLKLPCGKTHENWDVSYSMKLSGAL